MSKPDRKPLARVQIDVFVEDSADSLALGEVPVSKEDGRAELEVPADVKLWLWVHGADPEVGAADREVTALRPGERREIEVEIPIGDDLHFVGLVVDESTGDPIAGARVRLLRSNGRTSSLPDWTVRLWNTVEVAQVQSGRDGIFEVQLASWKQPYPHVRVEAEGYAVALAIPDSRHGSREHALPIPLVHGATLDARVLDVAGRPNPGVKVRLAARGSEIDRSKDDSGAFADLPDEVLEGTVAADGRCLVRDIPPAVPFEVRILEEWKLLHREADPLVFSQGAVVEREWRLGGGCTIHGLVVDQDDQPVVGQEIWLGKAFVDLPKYFQQDDEERMSAKATSDGSGRFEIADVAAGSWWLGAAPARERQETIDARAVAAVGTIVTVAAEASKSVTLRVYRGLWIRGSVVDPEGNPVSDCQILSGPDENAWGPWTVSRQDGTFALGPLAPGRLVLLAESSGAHATSDPVAAEPGATDVVLRLRPGGRLRGRVVDARTGEACRAEVMLTPEQPGPGIFGVGNGLATKEDGRFDESGLAPGRYGIAARTADGRFGVLGGVDVAVSAEPAELIVPVSPGGRLKLRYEGSKPLVYVRMLRSSVPIQWSSALEAGKIVELQAPAGSLVLELEFAYGERASQKSVELAPGEEKEVVFSDTD